MKRTFILLFLILILFSGFTQEYGLRIDESLSFTTDETSVLNNNVRGTFWGKFPLGERFVFEADLSAYWDVLNQPELPYYLNIDILKLDASFGRISVINGNPFMSMTLGRFPVSDITSYVLSHTLDGVKLNYNFGTSIFSTTLGYSGLLWKFSSTLQDSELDKHYINLSEEILSAPRIFGFADFVIPSLFRQSLSISYMYQLDMRPEDEMDTFYTGEGELNRGYAPQDTYYLCANLAGRILPILSYRVYGAYNGGRVASLEDESSSEYSFSQISAFMAGLNTTVSLGKFMNSMIAANFIWASGDSDSNVTSFNNTEGMMNSFFPMSDTSLGLVFSPPLSNLAVLDILYSINPFMDLGIEMLEPLQAMIRGFLFMKSSQGDFADTKQDSTDPVLGTEVDLIFSLKLFSDLDLNLSTGLFIWNENNLDLVSDPDTPKIKTSTRIGATLHL